MGLQLAIPDLHPWRNFLDNTHVQIPPTGTQTIDLGNIDEEGQGLDGSLTAITIATGGSDDTMEYDTDGVEREINFSGTFTGTATECSDFIVKMEALQNFKGGAGLYAPYVLSYTAGSFPSYPYTTLAAIGTTPRSYNVIVESFQWKRSSENPTSDIVNYQLKLKQRASGQ
jgi:hypothetical protein